MGGIVSAFVVASACGVGLRCQIFVMPPRFLAGILRVHRIICIISRNTLKSTHEWKWTCFVTSGSHGVNTKRVTYDHTRTSECEWECDSHFIHKCDGPRVKSHIHEHEWNSVCDIIRGWIEHKTTGSPKKRWARRSAHRNFSRSSFRCFLVFLP